MIVLNEKKYFLKILNVISSVQKFQIAKESLFKGEKLFISNNLLDNQKLTIDFQKSNLNEKLK